MGTFPHAHCTRPLALLSPWLASGTSDALSSAHCTALPLLATLLDVLPNGGFV